MSAQLELTQPTVKKSGKKWKVICPACGDVGSNTTEAYAQEAADKHVVEAHPLALQEITRPAPVLRFAEIPVDEIQPSSANPRGSDLGDLDGLKASIEAVGILQALTVECTDPTDEDAERPYRLIAGERRWTAAVELGLATVPCVVRDAITDDHRLEAMLVENLQREDVNPMGEARAFRQLEELGLSQRTIAHRVGCSQSHISKRLALLDLPVEVQKRVGGRDANGISVAAATELLRIKDDPKAVAAIAKKKDLDADRVAREVEVKLREQQAAAKEQKLRAEVKAAGWKTVEAKDWRVPAGVKLIATNEWSRDLKVDLTKHKKEPCHAVILRQEYYGLQVQHVCTDASRHGPKGASALKVPKQEKRALSPHEEKQRAEERARKAAAERRTEVLKGVLAPGRKKLDVLSLTDTIFRTVIRQLSADERRVCCELLGLGKPDHNAAEMWAAAGEDLGRVAAAAALAVGELRARAPYSGWGSDEIQDLYRFLRAGGYELDEFERGRVENSVRTRDRLVALAERVAPDGAAAVWIQVAKTVHATIIEDFFGDADDDTPVDQIDDETIARQAFAEYFAAELAEAGWPEDVPTCRKCGCTDDRACDGGCTWVEVDLCSECEPDPADKVLEEAMA